MLVTLRGQRLRESIKPHLYFQNIFMFCSGFISHVSRYTNGWHGNKTEGENQRILCAILLILCLSTNVLGGIYVV